MNTQIGLFGKLPSHGDFIERNLVRSFTTPWDDWLQRGLASSRELIGDNWLDFYLTSPVWRFFLSNGCIDSGAWAGVVLPSVDSVGRYFPLTFALPVTESSNPHLFLIKNSVWYEALEDIAIESLQQGFDADDTLLHLKNINHQAIFRSEKATTNTNNGWIFSSRDNKLSSNYALLLQQLQNTTLSSSTESQSLWWNRASPNRDSSLINCRGLPNAQQFTFMLNGRL